MKIQKFITILLIWILFTGQNFAPSASTQDDFGQISLSIPSPQEKLHALALTRFHFITLKQFHSALFSSSGEGGKLVSESQAQILNAGLNAFLTSSKRETMLLDALRQNKSVQLRFSVPEIVEDAYEVIDHPTKPLLYRLEPVKRLVPTTVEIKPFLDKPIAFEITLQKGSERHHYEVDWAGRIARIS